MKKIFLSLSVVIGLNVYSQKCDAFYYLQDNKTVEMTTTDKKGKVTTKIVYNISDVKKSGATYTSTVNSELFDAKGRSINKGVNNITCTGGVMMMDLKMFIPVSQQEQMGMATSTDATAYIEYPADMNVGDALKDGQFKMDFKTQAGLGGHVSVDITNRKVEAKESVTTAAGTWECFKITYHSKVVLKLLIGIPINADVTEWYAPGFGVVKTEVKGSKTEITSIK
jgi:hypothetical protein